MYFWATISKVSAFKIRGFWYSFVDSEIFLIFIPRISHEQLTISFSARTQYLLCVRKYIAQTVTNFNSRKYTKLAISDILKTTNIGVNMINRQMSPCFLSVL